MAFDALFLVFQKRKQACGLAQVLESRVSICPHHYIFSSHPSLTASEEKYAITHFI